MSKDAISYRPILPEARGNLHPSEPFDYMRKLLVAFSASPCYKDGTNGAKRMCTECIIKIVIGIKCRND